MNYGAKDNCSGHSSEVRRIESQLAEKDKLIEELEAVLKKGYPGLYPLMLRNYDYQRQVTQCRRINEDLQARIGAAVELFPLCADRDSDIPFSDLRQILTGKTEKGEAK